MQALDKLFLDVGLQTKEERAEFVQYMLGENDTTAPFYYRELPENQKPKARTTETDSASLTLMTLATHRAYSNPTLSLQPWRLILVPFLASGRRIA